MTAQPCLGVNAEEDLASLQIDEDVRSLVVFDLEGEVVSTTPVIAERLLLLAASAAPRSPVAHHPGMGAGLPLLLRTGAALQHYSHGQSRCLNADRAEYCLTG